MGPTVNARQYLRGHAAIVTGAGKGLGRAYALHLARLGAKVLVNNRRHPGQADGDTSAQQTVDAIEAAGGMAIANWCDVTDPDSGTAMVEQARSSFGRLDIVIANAGIDKAGVFAKQSMADFRAIFDTGFLGNLHLVHAAWPVLIGQKYGRAVLTTSSAGLYGNYGQAAYSAAKSAVIGMVRALAIEGRRHGVGINAIAPYGYSQMTAPYLVSRVGVIRPPGVGIFRPLGRAPNAISKRVAEVAILQHEWGSLGAPFWTLARPSDHGTRDRQVRCNMRCGAAGPAWPRRAVGWWQRRGPIRQSPGCW